MNSLVSVDYGSESDSEEKPVSEETTSQAKPAAGAITLRRNETSIAPPVVESQNSDDIQSIFPKKGTKELSYNVPFDALYKPDVGPAFNPTIRNAVNSLSINGPKNHLNGHLEYAEISDFDFERQRLTYDIQGYAVNPTALSHGITDKKSYFVGDVEKAIGKGGKTITEMRKLEGFEEQREKKKRKAFGDAGNLEEGGYLGPWAGYEGETFGSNNPDAVVAGMTPEERAEYQKMLELYGADKAKRRYYNRMNRKGINVGSGGDGGKSSSGGAPSYGKEDWMQEGNEKSIFHGKSEKDYLGRSYLSIPHDIDVRLDGDPGSEDAYPPKRCVHTFKGHNKGVNAIRLFPKSGHLLLSAGLDGRVKLWDMYHDRSCLRTFLGHARSVRGICFNNAGSQFLSNSYDKYIKLWDTETGACVSSYKSDHIPYCAKFNPIPEKNHLFLAGYANKKIIQWDSRSGKQVIEYDQHLDAVNSVTFIDNGRRFVSTSDDKSIRIWEFDIPIVVKYIAEPHMHSMPAVTSTPDDKWVLCQSMENAILVYSCSNEASESTDKFSFRINRRKRFVGHVVAGYACQPTVSPDGAYVASGDADGKLNVWEWKTSRMVSKIKAHDKVLMDAVWHPQEPSKVVTCSWDATIKLWD